MTRTQKIEKLARTIRAYRGRRRTVDGPFVIPPQRDKGAKILEMMTELGLVPTLEPIDNFTTLAEFQNWIAQIPNPDRHAKTNDKQSQS